MLYEVLSRSLGAAGRRCAVGRGKRDKMAVPPMGFCKARPERADELGEVCSQLVFKDGFLGHGEGRAGRAFDGYFYSAPVAVRQSSC